MRGLKKDDSPILTGLRFYHNHVLPNGMTPSEAVDIQTEGDNKWKISFSWRQSEVRRLSLHSSHFLPQVTKVDQIIFILKFHYMSS